MIGQIPAPKNWNPKAQEEAPQQLLRAELLRLIHALSIEINTGLKASKGSQLAQAQNLGWTTKRTKKGALQDLVKLARGAFNYTPSSTVKRAIEVTKANAFPKEGNKAANDN